MAEYKKPSQEELKSKLTSIQYTCTQQEGTEKPFANEYWNNKQDGIYVDVVNGQPLFSSLNKYDSGSGWPSFTKPLQEKSIKTKADFKVAVKRTEIRSTEADSHLGHVFDDGPKAEGGKRYCVNSASLNFIPLAQLKSKGLGRYLFEFADKKGWDVATIAGGCFWGMEELLKKHPGVIETEVGYTGGDAPNAKYELVKTGVSGHAEAVRVLFDPKKTTYKDVLIYFFKIHDPTTLNQQGNDVGTQYRSAIFYNSEKQKEVAQQVIDKVNKSKKLSKPVITQLVKAKEFWRAEDDHQDYLQKKPAGYTCHFVRNIEF